MVLRKRDAPIEAVDPVDGVPPELYLPAHKTWVTAAATVRWLEQQQVRRRMRGSADLADMGPAQRFNTAAREWAVAQGHPSAYDLDRKCFPNRAYIRELGIPIQDDIQERLRHVSIAGPDD